MSSNVNICREKPVKRHGGRMHAVQLPLPYRAKNLLCGPNAREGRGNRLSTRCSPNGSATDQARATVIAAARMLRWQLIGRQCSFC